MSRLTVLSDALTHLAALLHAHGPACVCAACTACQQALVLYPRLEHLLAILAAWSHGEADDEIWPDDLGMLLTVLEEGSTVRSVPPETSA